MLLVMLDVVIKSYTLVCIFTATCTDLYMTADLIIISIPPTTYRLLPSWYQMLTQHLSELLAGTSEDSGVHENLPTNVGFALTMNDIDILEQCLEEFGEADSKAQTKLVQRIMGELCRLHPVNTPFDKAEASKVKLHH